MPKKRQPREIWYATRLRVLERDGYKCVKGGCEVTEKTAHVDHIRSGKLGTNAMDNLRTLCRLHHVLRADPRHRGMLASALRDGILPEDWRSLVWDD